MASPGRMPSASEPDWEGVRLFAIQCIRARLTTARADTVKDLAQEVLVTLFRLWRRETLLDARSLTNTLAHRVCVDHVRRVRGPEGRLDALPDTGSPFEWSEPAGAVLPDQLELFRFLVLEQFRELDAPCEELASLFFAEQSWTAVAERLELRHSTVIKRWSRCMERVRRLVRTQKGQVWEWARSVERS